MVRVNMSEWLNRAEMKPEEAQYQYKLSFFEASLKAVPEFVYSNQYVTLKESERTILLEHLAKVEEEAKQLKQAQEEALKAQQT